jgi:hypothetical protein
MNGSDSRDPEAFAWAMLEQRGHLIQPLGPNDHGADDYNYAVVAPGERLPTYEYSLFEYWNELRIRELFSGRDRRSVKLSDLT